MSDGHYCLLRNLGPVKGGGGIRYHEVVIDFSWRGVVEIFRRLMSRAFSLTILNSLGVVATFSSVRALTLDEIVAKLETSGYSQIREIPSGKIKTFKAVKNGKETSVMVDATGHIKELQQ
jgi:hypothetical protein